MAKSTRGNSTRLKEYRAKRNFSRTPEPAAEADAKSPADRPQRRSKAASPSPRKRPRPRPRGFCVQKHLARQLHYDLRLEHNGVLLSWAVPKGPSVNPTDKRLAMKVEDHPLDYADFEGVIPEGYGAGIMMLWDKGTWTPAPESEDVDAALSSGELKFTLEGIKLKGSWTLVRTRGYGGGGGQEGRAWLLIKHRDQWTGDFDITRAASQSVKTFGDFEDILAQDLPEAWLKGQLPVKSGETSAMFRQIIERAMKLRTCEAGSAARTTKARRR